MSDPKDELGARFDERRANAERDESTDQADNADNSDNSNDTGNASDSGNKDNSYNPGNADGADNSSDTGNKPGPDRDETATRHRRQVPMYLPDEKANELNKLYERLDGRSKVVGDGGIEKHADFMETLVEFTVEHEDELAERLGIKHE
jgi:hypothetical protein